MKNLLLIFCLISGVSYAQVESVDYLLKYNCETQQYDLNLVILEGEASTITQRAQFNSQVSIVVPTGESVEVVNYYMPLQNNQDYEGETPLIWNVGSPVKSPDAQPESDFYGITPTLSPAAFYNNLVAGDVVKLFSITVGDSGEYDDRVRIFENGIDPGKSEMGGGDFSNGFTLGGPQQLFNDSHAEYCLTSTLDHLPQDIAVYPNPFLDEVTIELEEGIHRIQILDSNGKIYYNLSQNTSHTVTLNLSQCPAGLTIIKIETPEGTHYKKLIKI